MTNKELYRKFCQENIDIPIFSQDWWLDSVCEENWDISLIENQGTILAALPFHLKKKNGYNIILPPQLTQYIQLYINYPKGQKLATKIGFEKEKISELIDQLPNADYIELQLSPEFTNWLPFNWKEYKQTTKYTYRLEDLTKIDSVWNSFKDNIRREIKKAEKQIKIETSNDLSAFYHLNNKTFERQKIKNPYNQELFSKIDQACKAKNCRTIYLAKNENNNVHAAIYVVWDKNYSYYLAGGSDPEYRTSGAHSLLMWQAIKDAALRNQKFDFKGSMIESVERFFRGFGAEQKPYFKLKKYNSKLLKIIIPLLYNG